jgi:hypothetical protein
MTESTWSIRDLNKTWGLLRVYNAGLLEIEKLPLSFNFKWTLQLSGKPLETHTSALFYCKAASVDAGRFMVVISRSTINTRRSLINPSRFLIKMRVPLQGTGWRVAQLFLRVNSVQIRIRLDPLLFGFSDSDP